MTLDERVKRNTPEDQIEIGQIVENATKGQFGELLKSIVNGIVEEQLELSRRKPEMPADRYLGSISGLHLLQDRLDQCIDIKNELVVEKKDDDES